MRLKWARLQLLCDIQAAGGGGGPCPQDMQVSWTPTNLKLGEMLGFTFGDVNNLNYFVGVTSITIKQATLPSLIVGGNGNGPPNSLVSFSAPNLASVDPFNFTMDIQYNPVLTSVSFPLLKSLGEFFVCYLNPLLPAISFPSVTVCTNGIDFDTNASLTSIDLPLLVSVGGTNEIYSNPALTTINVPSLVPANGETIRWTGNALSASTVNAILARCVANSAYVSGSVDVSGGTNAAPTGQGIVDKATLIGRGVTVNTN